MAANNPPGAQPAWALTVDQLEPLWRRVVREELAEMAPAQRPTVTDRAGIARELHVSPGTIDKLRREGRIPEIKIGDSPRFVVADVIAALKGGQ